VAVLRQALRQLPGVNASARSVGRTVLVRIDGAGCSHPVLGYLHARRLGYSVGLTLPETTPDLLERTPEAAWDAGYGARGPARAQDRIRCMKDAGLRNLPLHGFDQNRVWLAVVALAADLLAWMQTLALHDHGARRWEPKRLRLRLFCLAGVLATTGRVVTVHL